MNTEYRTDWREPLYQCAMSHRCSQTLDGLHSAILEFTFLGNYRNSAECLELCRTEAERLQKKRIEEITGTKDLVEAACLLDALKQTRDLPGKEKALETAAAYFQMLVGREKRKYLAGRTAVAALLAGLLFLAVFSGIRFFKVDQPQKWQQVRELTDQEDYEGALALCRKLMPGKYAEKAEAYIPQLKRLEGYQKLEEGEYEQAVALLSEVSDEDGLKSARLAWGDALAARGKQQEAEGDLSAAILSYEEAEAQFLAAEAEQDRLTPLYGDLSRALAEEGDLNRAIEFLSKTGTDSDLDQVFMEMKEERYQRALAKVRSVPDPDPEFVQAEGSKLDDVNSQLAFCREIRAMGLDLAKVYPDGVLVKDVPLAAYQPTAENQGLKVAAVQEGKALVFDRKQLEGSRAQYRYYIFDIGHGVKADSDDGYAVRLLPDILFSLPEEHQAETLEDCTLYLLSDTIYTGKGVVTLKTKMPRTGRRGPTNYMESYYPLFTAVDSVAIYQKEKPDAFYLVDYQINRPEKYPAESAYGDFYTEELDTYLPDFDNYWGERDEAFLKDALNRGVAVFEE